MSDCNGGLVPSLEVNNSDCSCVSIASITWNAAGTQFTITLNNGQAITSPVLTGATGPAPTISFRVSGTTLQYSINGGTSWVSIYDLSLIAATRTLHNDITNSTTVGTALEILKTYPAPADTLSTNGSYLLVRAEFTTSTANLLSSTKAVGIYFNGNNVTGAGTPVFAGSNNKIILEARINRYSNTELKNEISQKQGFVFGGVMSGQSFLDYDIASMAGLNLTSTAYDITAQANSEAAADITCTCLTVTLFKK